jgi:hypothetical protein
MIYFCCDDRRRIEVRDHSAFNGIDFLEVLDLATPPDHSEERQRTLFVHMLKPIAGALTADNIVIEGGERIRDIKVKKAEVGTGDKSHVLTVEVDRAGDFSIYTLRLVASQRNPNPPTGFDRLLSAIDFSFKVECASDFDCRAERVCPPKPLTEPSIDYLAKDFASFRQLMLDRMSVILPEWKERNLADLGITLVELLAYVGDYLSYQQDATATESYLGTARHRVSVRRHARLLDYFMHEGSNARVWAQIQVNADGVILNMKTRLLTTVAGQPTRLPPPPDSLPYSQALANHPEVFETMHAATLYKDHNKMPFYTWGARECCLPKGATRATLRGTFPNLKIGDVIILEEVLGPLTGEKVDANLSHRHAVMLTEVIPSKKDPPLQDPIGGLFDDPPNNRPVDITEITWATEDALPFALCISSTTDADHGSRYLKEVSVARGNIVLADHGLSLQGEELGEVPAPSIFKPVSSGSDRCADKKSTPVPPRFRPRLKEAPLTHAALYDDEKPPNSASAALRWTTRNLLPQIELESVLGNPTPPWKPRSDLLNSLPDSREFVVEMESDGKAYVRFGDDANGLRPASGTTFKANYRIGNGTRGNVGAESLGHIVTSDSAIIAVCNPLPARGGVDPESMEKVRQDAPVAFQIQERAVTADDYAEVAERHTEVQRAAATIRWTGSWRTIFLTVDRLGGRPVDAVFEQDMRRHLERFRMAGHDVEIDGPQFVALEIEMFVCIQSGYFPGDVRAALLQVISNTTLPDGRRGFFHPDNFTFGQPVYLSRLYAAAQAVTGVRYVEIKKFQRLGIDSDQAITDGVLQIGRLEIARLDNDPNFRERGVLRFDLQGGR